MSDCIFAFSLIVLSAFKATLLSELLAIGIYTKWSIFLIEILPPQKQIIGLFSVLFASLVMSVIGRSISSTCVLGGSTILMGWGIGSAVHTGLATLSTTNLSNVVWTLILVAFGSIIVFKRRGVELVTMKPWRFWSLGFHFYLFFQQNIHLKWMS